MEEYVSVSEYAKMHGKDPGNIRKLLIAGRLPGQKVGNQWIIPKTSPYPEDKRENTGAYRNWRKRVNLNKNRELMQTISKMVPQLEAIYGDLLGEIIVYGSYARGDQSEESDVDIALILFDEPAKSTTNAMVECVTFNELELGKNLSVIEINAVKLNQWKEILPFYKNLIKEGIVIWKAVA